MSRRDSLKKTLKILLIFYVYTYSKKKKSKMCVYAKMQIIIIYILKNVINVIGNEMQNYFRYITKL